jgi:T5SS/PEP-CTERM-associated repeat protein
MLKELRSLIVSVLALLAGFVTSPLLAQERFWINSLGGSFNSTSNWSETDGGPGGASVPGSGDNARFTLDSTYTVTDGGALISSLRVADGNVTFDLNNTTLTAIFDNLIGSSPGQTGRLTVREGTFSVDSNGDDVQVGGADGSTGFLTVTTGGRIGDGTARPDVFVGYFGTGTLTVNDNGRIDGNTFAVGTNTAESLGTATITGPNAVANFSGDTHVGVRGAGTVSVTSGGDLTSSSNVVVGDDLGGLGAVVVSGIGSSWTISEYTTIGDAGDGTLTISSGGVVSSVGGDPVTLGSSATGIGTVTVTGAGSALTSTFSFAVGGAGHGALNVRSGGFVSAGDMVIGDLTGGEGRVEIEGAGSRVAVQNIYVGEGGNGILEITSGGRLDTCPADACNVGSGLAYVINGGAARVSGVGSTWVAGSNLAGALVVGGTGPGTLTVENGAHVETGGLLLVAHPAVGMGTVNFHGGSIKAVDVLRQGTFNWTDGTLTIDGGAFENNGDNLTINGGDADDLPTLHLAKGGFFSGMGALLTIGDTRQGAVIMSGAGSPIQQIRTDIGAIDGGSGVLTVTNGAQFTATGDVNLGGTEFMAGGSGTLNVDAASTVVVDDELRLWPGGTANVNGGTLEFAANLLHPNGGKINFNAGRIVLLGDAELFDARLDPILGPTHELGVGRTIHLEQGPVDLDASLNVAGGTFSGDSFNLFFGRTITLAGGQVTMSNNINISGRIFVNSGRLAAADIANNSSGEIHLAGPLATVAAGGLDNFGLLGGTGRVDAMLHNRDTGQVRVGPGERLTFANGPHDNDGLIDLNGGTIEFDGLLRNNLADPSTGLIAARNGTLRFHGGVTNAGSIVMSAGVMDVFGDIDNVAASPTTGRIVVSGGGTANFYDDITNSGSINVSAAGTLESTAVFFGSLSGNGVGGGGNVFIEGDARPGFSPGVMSFGGDVTFGPFASVAIELAGTTPGAEYDQIVVIGNLALDGTLEVSLINDFIPSAGQSFNLLDWGGLAGTFSSLTLPALSGLAWNTSQLYTTGVISVAAAPVLLGDYNNNGTVDAADYTVWRNMLGQTVAAGSGADGTGPLGVPDGLVDRLDYDFWKSHYGNTIASGSSSTVTVPEPSCAIMFLLALAVLSTSRRR